jgi:hypothetical protein
MNKRLKTEGNWLGKSPSKYNKLITKAMFPRWMDMDGRVDCLNNVLLVSEYIIIVAIKSLEHR